MDGENNGSKPYEQMDDLGGFSPIFGNTHLESSWKMSSRCLSIFCLWCNHHSVRYIPFFGKRAPQNPDLLGG